MTAEQFAYWLNGFTELTQGQTPNPAQWKSICEHLQTVFNKVTPQVGEVSVKIDVDAKDAQKAVDGLRKSYEDLQRATQTWPFGSYPPGTVICSTGQHSVADTASIITC
jgi:hypothetical protein